MSGFKMSYAADTENTDQEVSVDVKEEPVFSDMDENITIVKHEVDDCLAERAEVVRPENKVLESKDEFDLNCQVKHEVDNYSADGFNVVENTVLEHTDQIGEKGFECYVCSKVYACKGWLERHVLLHNGEKRFKCDVCSKGFALKHRLKNHMSKHTKDRPHECEACGKAFKANLALRRHQRSHTRKKQCDICSKNFSTELELRRHMVWHNGAYKCEICSKGFDDILVLTRHSKRHAETECRVCDKRFSSNHWLKIHTMKHTEGLDFACTKCTRRYTSSSLLKTHLNWHERYAEQCLRRKRILEMREPPRLISFCGTKFID